MSNLKAEFVTNRGTIHVNLFADDAPLTVASFVQLSQMGFYNDLAFHRVIPDFMVQGGCPEGSGRGGPGYRFEDECKPNRRHDKPGVLSMANAGPGTNGSQFFITHVATPWLDGKHTVFGAIVGEADQDVVDAIKQGDKIESLNIVGDAGALLEKFKDRLAGFATAAKAARRP